MTEKVVTNGQSTLNGTISSGATSLVVTSASSFPASGNFRILVDNEIMLVTGVSSTTFTVTRGVEGTSAASHSTGANVYAVLTATGLTAFVQENGAVGQTNGSAALSGDFTLNASNGTYQDTGLSVSLPAAGTYLVVFTVQGGISTGSAPYVAIRGKLYNSTDSSDASTPVLTAFTDGTGVLSFHTGTGSALVTIAGAKTIKLYAKRDFPSGTPTTNVLSGTETRIDWVRVA